MLEIINRRFDERSFDCLSLKDQTLQPCKNDYLVSLHYATLDLLHNQNPQDLLQSITVYAAELINAPYVEIMFKEDEELVVWASNTHRDKLVSDRAKRQEATLAWKAVDTKEVVTIDDYSSFSTRRALYDEFELKAVACFPIIVSEACIGVLDISRVEPDQIFTEEQIRQAKLFVQLIAALIQNINLREVIAREKAQRREADEKLRISKESQLALLSAIPDALFRFDSNGTFLDYHVPTATELIISPETFMGQKIIDILPPETAQLHMMHINEVLQTGTAAVYEFSITHSSKQEYFECRMVKSGLSEVLAIFRNISDRKVMEQQNSAFLEDMKALQEIFLTLAQINDLETLYRNIIQLTQERLHIDRVGLFIIDPNTNELRGTFGIGPDGQIRSEDDYREYIGDNHWTMEVLKSPKHTRFQQNTPLFDNAQKIGTGWNAASALWDGNTSIGYLVSDNFINHQAPRVYQEELMSLLGSTYGHLIRLIRAKMSLQQNEERQRRLLNAIPDLMFRVNKKGEFLDYYPAKPDLLTLDSTQFVGKEITEVLSKDIAETHMQYVKDVLQSGESRIFEDVVQVNGHPINFETRMVHFGADEVLAIVRDITERKKLEQQSFALALQKAQGKLLSKFVQNASHEFRTPLSIINTAVYLMARSNTEDKRQQYANKVASHIEQLSHLIDMIISTVKLDSEITLHKQPIDLQEWIRSFVDALQDRLKTGALSVNVRIEHHLPKLLADRSWLQEALKHIMDNAIRFTPSGGSISISAYQNQWDLVVEIKDTGIGISQEALPHIFDHFWRQDEAHSTPGFGLGLPIALKIVEMHGGRIEVRTKLGQGSAFRILLPLKSIS